MAGPRDQSSIRSFFQVNSVDIDSLSCQSSDSESRPSTSREEQTSSETESSTSTRTDGTVTAVNTQGPNDISTAKDLSPVQPILSSYRKRSFSTRTKHNRSFQASWFKKYKWLEYSIQEDKAYCFACRFFSTRTNGAFKTNGFNDWKHAFDGKTPNGKERGALPTHDLSSHHKDAVTAWLAYNKSKQTGTIMSQLSSSYARSVEVNRYYMKTIAEIILFCAMHDLPLRGHSEDENALTRGVFLDFVDLVAHHDSCFKDRLKSIPNNAKYLSSDIQNEILSTLSQMVLAMITNECLRAEYFSVSADETKDNSKNELLTVSLRYFHAPSCMTKEVFTGFVNLDDLGAENITRSIVRNVEDIMKLSMVNCISSTFDGASTMSGAISGVQARLKKVNPHILYTHCFNHVLNLCLVDTVKSVDNARQFFDLLQALLGAGGDCPQCLPIIGLAIS